MGCIESRSLKKKQRFRSKKFKRQFQIPDIVIEEYISRSSVENLSKKVTEDYIWLTDTKQPTSEWFVHNCDAITAEYLLRDKPNGTFLVRDSRRHEGQYVLAVSLHYFVHQLLICKTDEGFGLIDPGVHPTLQSLINHYSEISLKTKSVYLDIKLTKGVFQWD